MAQHVQKSPMTILGKDWWAKETVADFHQASFWGQRRQSTGPDLSPVLVWAGCVCVCWQALQPIGTLHCGPINTHLLPIWLVLSSIWSTIASNSAIFRWMYPLCYLRYCCPCEFLSTWKKLLYKCLQCMTTQKDLIPGKCVLDCCFTAKSCEDWGSGRGCLWLLQKSNTSFSVASSLERSSTTGNSAGGAGEGQEWTKWGREGAEN